MEFRWIQQKVEGWSESVRTLAGMARKHPQSAYAGLQKSIQQEWSFVQRVTPGIGDAFGPVEEEIATVFLRELFRGRGRWSTREGNHPPASEAGEDGPPGTNADGP